MAKRVVYVSKETYRMIRMFAIGRTHDEVVRDAVVSIVEGGGGYVIDFPRSDEKYRIEVSEDTHYLINRLKIELDYKTQDDLLFDVMVNYLRKKGMSGVCIRELLEVE